MANLLSGTYDYAVLSKKYGNFCVPALKIKVNGVDTVTSMKLTVLELQAKLVLEGTSIIEFKIADAYTAKNHSFDSKVKSKFTLGTIVEVELGYLSSTCSIFKGYVAMVGAEFEELPLFVVTLMDARRLMMVSGTKQLLHDVKNYSDAFRTIMGSYSKLCTPKIDSTNDKLDKPLSQNNSDYDFIMKGMIQEGKVNREFFILGDTAYFRKPRSVKAPVMTMKYGQELMALSVQEEYLNLDVEVIGYSAKEQKSFVGKSSAKSASQQKNVTSKTPVYTVSAPDADSQEKVKERAEALAQKQVWKSRTGEGTVIGMPELVPGRFVAVKDLEKMVDNKYYITEVTHQFNNEKFQTVFTIGGW